MSKFYNHRKILSFRDFDKLDPDTYVTYDLAWPVEIVECYANKVSDDILDGLAETVLELLAVPEMTSRKIAELLRVSDEVISGIIKTLVSSRGFITKNKNIISLTDKGKEYLDKKETGDFHEEKVFGNMFVSRIDGDVFPYFHEGKLPWGREYEDIMFLSYNGEEPSSLKSERADVLDRINRSFHRYGRISKSSRELERSGINSYDIDYIEEELREQSFDDEPETMAQKDEIRNLKNARIKLLKTQPKQAYIRVRLVVSKAAPNKFIVDSPFNTNVTSWYSECFHRMKENNELIYIDEDETGLDYFCDGVTTSFYQKYPEMQGTDFEQFVKIRYPRMLSCSISKVCLDKYKEVFQYNNLCNRGQIKRHTVVTESVKALELIFNNYIKQTNKSGIVEKYKTTIIYGTDIRDMMDQFDIQNSSAEFVEKKKVEYGKINQKQSIMTHFLGKKDGHSIVEKYYFLVVDAYFNTDSHFRKLLLNEDVSFIEKLDFLNRIRNTYGAHNDGDKPKMVPEEDFNKFQEYFTEATQILLSYLD